MSAENSAKIKKFHFIKIHLDKVKLECYTELMQEVCMMNAKEIVKTLMKSKDMSNVDMAAALDITPAALWDRLNPKKTDNMTVNKLNAMLRLMGYEVVIMPCGKADNLEDVFVVDKVE